MVLCKSCWNLGERYEKFKDELFRNPLQDIAALALVVSLPSITYVYGMFFCTPIFINHTDYSIFIKILLLISPNWLLFGILGNVYYIRKRNSAALKLLPVPHLPADDPTNGLGYTSCNMQLPESSIMDHATAFGNDEYFDFAKAVEMDKCATTESLTSAAAVTFSIDTCRWHSCGICQIKVPARAWHCNICKTCILRRDHHCKFAMACIGEENHANFLGFLLYMPLSAIYAFLMGSLYRRDFIDDCPIWLTTLKSLIIFYPMIFEFGFHNILLCTILQFPILTFGFFVHYFRLALQGKTAYDSNKKISRRMPGESLSWYSRLTNFLGSHPFARILIPCFPAPKITYEYNADVDCLSDFTPAPDKNINGLLRNLALSSGNKGFSNDPDYLEYQY